jgi:hypothetical protein
VKFWVPWTIDALMAVVLLYFFFAGLIDGSVSSRNIGLWLLIISGLAGVAGGGLWLKSANHPCLATALLLIPALPGVIYGLFLLFAVITGPRWN